VAQGKCNASDQKAKRLSAHQVYQLTVETLQEHFDLSMDGKRYEAQDIWDVLVAAAVERMTVESATALLADAPCANTVRNALRGLLPGDEGVSTLEAQLNEILVAHLSKHLLAKPLPCAVDITEIPYHGQHDEEDEGVRRGRAKHGTTHFHCYATLYTVKNNKRYTLALTLVRRSDKVLDLLKRLLERGQALGLRLKRLYLDRGFDNNAVVAYLKQQPFPAILPLKIQGKQGGTRVLLHGRKSHFTTYTRHSQLYGTETLPVVVVCKYSGGRYRRQGLVRFAYLVIGNLSLPPHQVFEEYRHRFAVEASYRLMNQMRIRTTSTWLALRLFLVGLALLLLNLWSFIKWTTLFIPQRGPRQVLHHLLPLARWRLWLWEMIKQRLGFVMDIIVPLPSIAVY